MERMESGKGSRLHLLGSGPVEWRKVKSRIHLLVLKRSMTRKQSLPPLDWSRLFIQDFITSARLPMFWARILETKH